MPTVVDSRGVTIYIDEDEAISTAQDMIDRLEQVLANDEPLSMSEQLRVQSDYQEAARLLAETGDVLEATNGTRVPDSWLPQSEQHADRAERDEERRARARRIAEALLLYEELGHDDDDQDDGSVAGENEPPEEVLSPGKDLPTGANEPPEQKDIVGMRLERSTGMYVVYGGNQPDMRIKDRVAAEAEGWRRARGRRP